MSPKGSKNKGDKENAKRDYIPKFKFLTKSAIAPYPDEDLVPIYLNGADDERSYFEVGHVMRTRSKDNCEAYHRMGMFVCLGASAVDVGAQSLMKHVQLSGNDDIEKH